MDNLVGVLWKFGLASSLEINQHKNVAYWLLVQMQSSTGLGGEISIEMGCHQRFVRASQEGAMRALVSKWTIQALLPNQVKFANLVLRYLIKQLQPSQHGSWGPSSLWLFSPNFSIKGGSKVWRHIAQSWKVMACTMTFLSPSLSCLDDILQLNLLWPSEY